ncbi:Myosin-3 [Trichinella patagoniensis]|uniref:Tyrosine-protein kinase receptor n=2 Tax=Trichinella patagoniensis TaxID=990121 RepID=A0A0V1AAD4_9BILA|nr:Myosin-3 [Trichinella patagoniensis]
MSEQQYSLAFSAGLVEMRTPQLGSSFCNLLLFVITLCVEMRREAAGAICNFESPCQWNFEPPSSENGFRIVSGTEISGQSGHYAYFGTSNNEETVAKIVSPFFQHTATHCKLKFRYRLHGMPRTELIVVLETMPDRLNTTRPPMQLKMFPAKIGVVSNEEKEVTFRLSQVLFRFECEEMVKCIASVLVSKKQLVLVSCFYELKIRWSEEMVSIGQFPWPMRIRLEAWLNNKRTSNPTGNYSADCMIDHIHLVDCEEELYHTDSCMSNRTEKYRCPSNKVCIEWDQLCDMSLDCYGGEDEDATLHNCSQVPMGARCTFENGTCGWTSDAISEFRWVIANASSKIHIDKESRIAQNVVDHTLRNSSGHFLFVEPGSSEKMLRAHYTSPLFPAMSKSLQDPESPYYQQCRIRFFYHHFSRDWHSVFLFLVSPDGRERRKIWEEDKLMPSLVDYHDFFWHRVSTIIPFQDNDYKLQFVAIRMAIFHGNFGLDDISMTPQCFLQGFNEASLAPVYNFSTCGAAGSWGPNQTMCDSAYNNTPVEVKVLDNWNKQGVQSWKVPFTGEYRVVAGGAAGGLVFDRTDSPTMSNKGALVESTFNFTKNEQLWIAIGQQGQNPCASVGAGSVLMKTLKAGTAEICGETDLTKLREKYNLIELPGTGGGGATFLAKMNITGQKMGSLLLVAAGGGGQYFGGGDFMDSAGRDAAETNVSNSGSSMSHGLKVISGGGGGADHASPRTHLLHMPEGRTFAAGARGGVCSSFEFWKAAGGFGGGGASCGPGGGGGGGFVGGDGGNYSHGQGGRSMSFTKTAVFFPDRNPGSGFISIYPCLKVCPDASMCRFMGRMQVCICYDGQLLNTSDAVCQIKLSQASDLFSTLSGLSNQDKILIMVIFAFTFLAATCFVISFIAIRHKCLSRFGAKTDKKGYTRPGMPMEQFIGQNFHSEYNPNYEFFNNGDTAYNLQDLKEIPRCCVLLIKALGQGAFGEVYEGTLVGLCSEKDGLPVAVKTLPEYASEQAQMDFHMEAMIMSKFRHPNIVQFHGVCFEKMPRFIVLELLAGGDLKTFLRENRPKEGKPTELEIFDLLQIALDVAKGCKYLEENHFIHRDIAARNCLLTTKSKSRVVKIADFGMARDIYRADYYRKGGKAMLPVKWMPPEAFLDGIFTSKTDVWSYGVLLWEIFSMGYMPYPGRGNQEVMQLVTAGGRLECPSSCPLKLYQIMTHCWNTVSESRPNFDAIISRLEACMHDPLILTHPLPKVLKPCLTVDTNTCDSIPTSAVNNNNNMNNSCLFSNNNNSEAIFSNLSGIKVDLYPPYQRKKTSFDGPGQDSIPLADGDCKLLQKFLVVMKHVAWLTGRFAVGWPSKLLPICYSLAEECAANPVSAALLFKMTNMPVGNDSANRMHRRFTEPDELNTRSKAKKYDSKKSCWIPDAQEGYIAAEIKSTKVDQLVVITEKGLEKTVRKEETQEMNPPKFDRTEDMSNLTFLNDASVLHNLRQRYYSMLIYTYSGLFCVVINPYKRLPIYGESVVHMYQCKRRNEMPPHLFAVADEAYRNMMQDRGNQSMLITGESGAGKTENTKKVISYFAVICSTHANKEKDGKKRASLEEQIVQTNPVLEAFGNAKTVRNNNSSRFGKFIRIHFNGHGKLAGADIEHYLLEKSRVIKQAQGERCFHIFYQIMSGKIAGLKEKLFLSKDIRKYKFISQAEITIDGVDDKEEMQITDDAFDIMNFDPSEKENLYKLCAAILHMEAELAAKLLCVNCDEFLKALLKPKVKVGTEWVNKSQNLEQVTWGVGALCKAIYARMFRWLILRCNRTLDVQELGRKFFIGVLDIAGFEIFDFNSFEQLWINFVNEKLQQYFNHHMFVLEQEEYKSEGIAWEFIDFGLDLEACIQLIEKPLGIISMLDEECIVPKASDMTFVQKLNDQHLGKHPNFQKARPPKGKQSEAHFSIVHYAGTVRYNANGWLEKNKDPLNESVVNVLKASDGNKLLSEVWADYFTQEDLAKKKTTPSKKKGKAASFLTVSMMYRESLGNLMSMLRATHPHFIRCIIPNESKKSGIIEAGLVLNQLTCNGVLEGIRICRKGYPNRLVYADFKQRYAIFAADEAKKYDDPKKSSEAILNTLKQKDVLKAEEFQVGATKVFFKAGILARLEELHDEELSKIMVGVQATARSYLAKLDSRRRKKAHEASLLIQKNVRKWLKLRSWSWFRLYGRVKPLLTQAKQHEEFEKIQAKIKARIIIFSFFGNELEAASSAEKARCADMEAQLANALKEKSDLILKLESEKSNSTEYEQKAKTLSSQMDDLNKQHKNLHEKLEMAEEQHSNTQKAKKKLQEEVDKLTARIVELELLVKKHESDKQSLDMQLRSLKDAALHQEDAHAKLSKEKKASDDKVQKLTQDLHAVEDKVVSAEKVNKKLENSLEEAHDALEREKRLRQELEKAKRKTDGDLKVTQENMEEILKLKQDLEMNVKKKEDEIGVLNHTLEDEQSTAMRLQKVVKDLQVRVAEVEEDLNMERQNRNKIERRRKELQDEMDELQQQLEEAGGASQAQIELNKKREAEIAKLKREQEEAALAHEAQISSLKKKHTDAVAELNEQLNALQNSRIKLEKGKSVLQKEIEELHLAVDSETKSKAVHEKQVKSLEAQLVDLQTNHEETLRQLKELELQKSRLVNESTDLQKQLEEQDVQLNNLLRAKQTLSAELERTKQSCEEEMKQSESFASQLRNVQEELSSAKEQLEEEAEIKTELHRMLSKANAETQQWRAKYEQEGLRKTEELEDAKKKLVIKLQSMQEEIEAANLKANSAEKLRQRVVAELEDAVADSERANGYAQSLERKQRGFDKILDEWKQKCDDLSAELDSSQRENKAVVTELYKLRQALEEATDREEAVRRENKMLAQEIQEINDQLGEGGKNYHEVQKTRRRLEMEKEELQNALDEAESALETEENKVMRHQIELVQVKQEVEKRLQEKEEEFENVRRNHAKALESVQATLEAESRGRMELMKAKKKLESDINDLEIALDQAAKGNVEAQRLIKRYQEQIRELQAQIDEEQRLRNEMKEKCESVERKCHALCAEKEELTAMLEGSDRARRNASHEVHQAKEQVNDLIVQLNAAMVNRRKLEAEYQLLQVCLFDIAIFFSLSTPYRVNLLQLKSEMEEMMESSKVNEEKSRKATLEAVRLSDELKQEQDHCQVLEQRNKSLEQQIKDMQSGLEEAELSVLKGNKKYSQKLENKIRDLEMELDINQKKYQESEKNRRKSERQVKELQYQVDETKKNEDRLHELIDKLQNKVKTYKRQIEETEQLASLNLSKYRQLQHQLQDAEERADVAENSLAKMRAKNRSQPYRSSSTIASPRDLSKCRSLSALNNSTDEES